jgi:hypothetical protein
MGWDCGFEGALGHVGSWAGLPLRKWVGDALRSYGFGCLSVRLRSQGNPNDAAIVVAERGAGSKSGAARDLYNPFIPRW